MPADGTAQASDPTEPSPMEVSTPTEPTDPRQARLAAQTRVLQKEFDLEIFIKRCEHAAIVEEIEKGEKLLAGIKMALLGGTALQEPIATPHEVATPLTPAPEPQPVDPFLLALQAPPPMRAAAKAATLLASAQQSSKPIRPPSTAPIVPTPTPPPQQTVAAPARVSAPVPAEPPREPTPEKVEGEEDDAVEEVEESDELNASPTPDETLSPRTGKRRTPRKIMNGDGALVARNADGALVTLACPGCGKSNFSNLQGFVNHTRISHQITFADHALAIQECGTVVMEEGSPLSPPTSSKPPRGTFSDPRQTNSKNKKAKTLEPAGSLQPHPPLDTNTKNRRRSAPPPPPPKVEEYEEVTTDEE